MISAVAAAGIRFWGVCKKQKNRLKSRYGHTLDFDGIASTESGAFFPISEIFEHIPLKNLVLGTLAQNSRPFQMIHLVKSIKEGRDVKNQAILRTNYHTGLSFPVQFVWKKHRAD